MHRQLKNPHFYLMIVVNAVLFIIAHAMAYLFRFEFVLKQAEIWQFAIVLPWLIPLKSVIFLAFGLYRGMWRYTSLRELWRLAQACFVSMLLIMTALLFIYRFEGFSFSVYLLDAGFTFFLAGGLRMAIRSYFISQERMHAGRVSSVQPSYRKRVLVIGAGDAGVSFD